MQIEEARIQYNALVKDKAYELYNGTCYAVAAHYEGKGISFLRGWKRGNISCPEHNDKSPSLKIYRDTYKCFTAGCNMHGDAYRLIMHIEGCGFSDAQRIMAAILGIPTFSEFIGKPGSKMRPTTMSKPFPVSDRVLSLLNLKNDTPAILTEKSVGWISGEDPKHTLQGREAAWISEDSTGSVHYLIGKTENISLKKLWNDGYTLFVNRIIKGKISERFEVLLKEYNSNKWNDKESPYYQKYELHDILEGFLEELKAVGEQYGIELSYKKTPTYK